jgi:hypothetical protein
MDRNGCMCATIDPFATEHRDLCPARSAQTWETVAKATAVPGSEPTELILGEMGEQRRVVFRGEPWSYEAVWSEDDLCVPHDPQRNPPHVGIMPACRVRMNVWLIPEGRMQWWEMSAATFRILLRHRERSGRDGLPVFDERVFQIERMDTGDAEPIYSVYESSGMTPQLHSAMLASHLYALNTCGRHAHVPDRALEACR